jgi:hypothetical protein
MFPAQPAQEIPETSLAHAESLYRYAAPRLDAFSLRCWIIQRLMLDDGLGHENAERAFENVVMGTTPYRRRSDAPPQGTSRGGTAAAGTAGFPQEESRHSRMAAAGFAATMR